MNQYKLKNYNHVLLFGIPIGTIRHYEDKDDYKFRLLNIKSICKINPQRWNNRKDTSLIKFIDEYECTTVYFRKIPVLTIQYREAIAKYLNPPQKERPFGLLRRKILKQKRYRIIQNKLRDNQPINVLFFVSRIGCWLWEGLYKLFSADSRFHVTVCVIPWSYNGHYEMCSHMKITYQFLKENGYNVIATYDSKTDTYYDVKKLQPDIIFHDKAWFRHIPEQYYMTNFDETINFFVEYGISGALNPDGHFNLVAHHLADTYFMASNIHYLMSKKIAYNKGRNAIFLGYPKLDPFFDFTYKPIDVWKPQSKRKKRIIWAPHFIFFPSGLYRTGVFEQIYDIMINMAKKYEDFVQFAFKPHPLLQAALYNKPVNGSVWGKQKTDEYYKTWAELSNGQLEEGAITDLFLTSDAMILDSISFMAEYSATNKPALFTISKNSELNFDEFGQAAFDALYKTEHLESDIDSFIHDVVLEGNDPMRKKRENFIQEALLPPNQKSASENIYQYVIRKIQRN